jgi:hypothetical protein
MESLVRKEMSPRVSAEQQTSGDLVKRIRKLRWIGMGSEAEALQATITNDPQVASRRHTAAPQTMPSAEPMRTRKEKIEQNIAELIAAFPLAFSTEPDQAVEHRDQATDICTMQFIAPRSWRRLAPLHRTSGLSVRPH